MKWVMVVVVMIGLIGVSEALTVDLNSNRGFPLEPGQTLNGSVYSCPLRTIVWGGPRVAGKRVAGWSYIDVAVLNYVPKGIVITNAPGVPVGNYGWSANAKNTSLWSAHLVIALTCRYTSP